MNILKDILKDHKKIRNYDSKELIKYNSKFIKIIKENNLIDMTLKGYQEIIQIKDKNIDYHIIKTDTDSKILAFCIYINIYHQMTKKVKDQYILPLDYEFNTKKVALMQLNFETEQNDRFIFIIYPPQLSKYWYSFLIKKILGNHRILKILHGSEALDIPYMFNDLIQNKKYTVKFTNSFIDTRYICEYYNLENNLKERKCKIYDFLLDHQVIDSKKVKELEKNSEAMGPIYDIIIDIKKISPELLKYTLYDVLFLKYLYLKFPKNKLYQEIIPEFTRFNILEKRGITNKLSDIVLKINTMNNYFIKEKNNTKLIDLYNNSKLIGKDYDIENLEKINYFKNTIEVLKKYIIYKKALQKYNVFINKKNKFNFKFAELNLSSNLNNIINAFESEIKKSFT
jgi:hypothetical protein